MVTAVATISSVLTHQCQGVSYLRYAMTYILTGILLYLSYRFITGFLLPVVRTTRRVKQQFNDMRQRMQQDEPSASNSGYTTGTLPSEKPKFDVEGEYIQFEETR